MTAPRALAVRREQAGRLPIHGGATFPLGHRLRRAGFRLAWLLLCRWTPPPLALLRRAVLRGFGARLAAGADVRASARLFDPRMLELGPGALIAEAVECLNVATVRLDEGALVSRGAVLCTASHAVDDPAFPLTAAPITLGPRAWVCSGAFVGPGVRLGEGAVLGARGAAFRDLAGWTVHGGNPALPLRRRARHAAQVAGRHDDGA